MAEDTQELVALRDFAATTLGSGLEIEDRSRAFGRKSVTWRITSDRQTRGDSRLTVKQKCKNMDSRLVVKRAFSWRAKYVFA